MYAPQPPAQMYAPQPYTPPTPAFPQQQAYPTPAPPMAPAAVEQAPPATSESQRIVLEAAERKKKRQQTQKRNLVFLLVVLVLGGIVAGVFYYRQEEKKKADAAKRKAEDDKEKEEQLAAAKKKDAQAAEGKTASEGQAAPDLQSGGAPKSLAGAPAAAGDLAIPSVPTLPTAAPAAAQPKAGKPAAPAAAVPDLPALPTLGVPAVPAAAPAKAAPAAAVPDVPSTAPAAAPAAPDATGDTVSNEEWEIKRLKIDTMSRIFMKKGGILKAEEGFEFLCILLEMKCLKLNAMSIKGVTKQANILDLSKIIIVDETQGVYECQGYGPAPEKAQMNRAGTKAPKLVFTEKEMERTEYLLFQVNAVAKGFKLQFPNLAAMVLPAEKK